MQILENPYLDGLLYTIMGSGLFYYSRKNPDTSEDVLYIQALNQSVQTLAGSFVTTRSGSLILNN